MTTKTKKSEETTIVQVRGVNKEDHNLFKAWCSEQGIHMGEVLRKFITVLPKDKHLQDELRKFLNSYLHPEENDL